MPTLDHDTVAAVLGVDQSKDVIHTTFAGGSFGRRVQPTAEFAAELAAVASPKWPRSPATSSGSRASTLCGARSTAMWW